MFDGNMMNEILYRPPVDENENENTSASEPEPEGSAETTASDTP